MENAYQEEQSQRENYRQEKDYAEDQDRVLRTFNHWVILGNLYPYDLIAKEHDMLMPKRVFGKMSDCNREEWDEYKEIINLLEAENRYDAVLENFSRGRSILRHLHIHLLVYKDNYAENQ